MYTGLKAVVLIHAHHQVQQRQLILLPHLGYDDDLAKGAGDARNLSVCQHMRLQIYINVYI